MRCVNIIATVTRILTDNHRNNSSGFKQFECGHVEHNVLFTDFVGSLPFVLN
jgi:hypothetical protein